MLTRVNFASSGENCPHASKGLCQKQGDIAANGEGKDDGEELKGFFHDGDWLDFAPLSRKSSECRMESNADSVRGKEGDAVFMAWKVNFGLIRLGQGKR